jgi:hypothetical protein
MDLYLTGDLAMLQKQKLSEFLADIDKKHGCHCVECINYMDYVKFPIHPALEPLIDVAKARLMSKEF